MELNQRDTSSVRKTEGGARVPSPRLAQTKNAGPLEEAMSRLQGFNATFMAEFARRKRHVWVKR